ncbi:MAG: hypothetical protein RLZZ600_694, partial [Actinomycetota bacterium]
GGGIGGAVAMTNGAVDPRAQVSATVDAQADAESTPSDATEAPAVPDETATPEVSAEPSPEPIACDADCKASHVNEYLASAKLGLSSRSASDSRLCLTSNCGEREGRYCIIEADSTVSNCIMWNGWGDGWLDLWARGHGVNPRDMTFVDADAAPEGIRLSPGEPVGYVGN